jgi:toxin YoeB
MNRAITFQNNAFDEYSEWAFTDKKVFIKIQRIIKEIQRTPFEGIGKPEPLKYNKTGIWSRQITKEHRITYEVMNDKIIIYSCKGHYE